MLTFEVESHNKVSWSFKRKYLWIWVGLFIGLVAVILMMVLSPAAARIRNAIIATASVVAVGTAIWLIISTPNTVTGYMERQPDRGEVHVERFWLPFLKPKAETYELEAVESFALDRMTFERSSGDLYTLSRLWVIVEAETILLCDWSDPDSVDALGGALAKAARKPYSGTDEMVEDDGTQ